MQNNLKVTIWNQEVGRLSWSYHRKRAVFQYNRNFLEGDCDIAPLTASIHNAQNKLPFYGETYDNIFYGLPAFISDSLPGRWGNTVFSAWAEANGIKENELTPVDKLSFIGSRAMGALEFEPAQLVTLHKDIALEDLYQKAQKIQEERENLVISVGDLTLESLYEVGTSAGGQHTKAIIARNNHTGEIRSGQIMLPPEYTYYLLKFAEKDYKQLPIIEYVYSKMAAMAGIHMMPCELVDIGGKKHFLTQRYDRRNGEKVHTQSLAAMNPCANSYEDLMQVCENLQLTYSEREETFRRMVFNVLATNVDAHVKNFSFMMDEKKQWHITPAYDLTFSCLNPGNGFDPAHALRIGGKVMDIRRKDLLSFALRFSIKDASTIIQQVADAVMQFRTLAINNGIELQWIDKIEGHFAQMNPDILSSLTEYMPNEYEFVMNHEGIFVTVSEAKWQEMGNGAMRLTANLNGQPFRVTFAKTSDVAKKVKAEGGGKMSKEKMKEYVEHFFVSKYFAINGENTY